MIEKLNIAMIGDFPSSEHNVGGGVESVMLYLSREIARYGGIELDIVTMDRWNLGAREIEIDGFRVHYIAQSKRPSRLGTSQNIYRMRDLLRDLSPDLVHAHIAGYYSDAARLSGLPWILTLHGIRFLEANLKTGWLNQLYRSRVIRREEKRGVRSAPSIIAINPFVNESFTDDILGTPFNIENPVDDEFFKLQQINTPFSVLYAGRLTPRKDIFTLLTAFRMLLSRVPNARLKLAGSCDSGDPDRYCQQLKDFVRDNEMVDQVDFLGQIESDELLDEYSRASVSVLAAVLETAPMAIAEAMAAATAVVTTNAGGSRHMVDDRVTGRVVESRDPKALAVALEETLGDDGRALERGSRGRQSAERRFRASRVASDTLNTYFDLLQVPTESRNAFAKLSTIE